MTDNQDPHLSPHGALTEIDRVNARARQAARWTGWLWIAAAATVFAFYLGTGSGIETVVGIAAPLPLVVTPALYLLEARRRVIGRVAARIERPVATAFVGVVVIGTVVKLTVLPAGLTVWLVVFGLAMALPCLVGAWRVLRA
ncbi:hypothetical protein GCM10010174_49010 [Kutzneria viridogrisea]|uniref:Uncharacterized protein n=2 Tax=Kutzneria TaxID=43356 RepID=W5WLX3_9PSEU|nr:hypothetical protein [Kutzneria albida]AHH99139.1 hypothetical protein KALB_5778 [Kutzneria albida DSM 43870]MBA8923308.1 hypothetical protein [Kutzneria viridogrisea]